MSLKRCRTCLCDENSEIEFQSLFLQMEMAGVQTFLSEMLMACASIQIESGDGLPELICRQCVDQLNNAYQFKQQCELNDVKLRGIKPINNNSDDGNDVKLEDTMIIKPDIDDMDMDWDDSWGGDDNDDDIISVKQTKKVGKRKSKSSYGNNVDELHLNIKEEAVDDDADTAVPLSAFKNDEDEFMQKLRPNRKQSTLVEEQDDDDQEQSRRYECSICKKILTTFNGLQIHKRRHSGKNLAQCYLCIKTFTKMSHLKRHLLAHGVKNENDTPGGGGGGDGSNDVKIKLSFQCEFCDRKFVYRKSFSHHLKNEHAISDTDEAATTAAVTPVATAVPIVKTEQAEQQNQLNLIEKIEADAEGDEETASTAGGAGAVGTTDEIFECHVCSHKFIRANHLTRHMTLHRNVLNYKCDQCEKAYLTEMHLQQHIQQLHSTKPYSCISCNVQFERGEHLIRHLKMDHPGIVNDSSLLKCSLCDQLFETNDELAAHIKQHLLKDKRHICPICNKAFNRLDNLRTHQRVHNSSATTGTTSTTKDQTRLHLCIYCGKEFNNSSNMIVHMRRHTGERPYKCQVCGKGFPRSHDLKCHERTHSGERPYLCTLCGKSFNKSNKLVRHTRVHTGERPYVCNLCGRAFTQSNDLALHMRRHTGSRPYACGICPARFIQSGQLKAHRRSQGHWVEQEVQFRGNRVEPVHIEGLVETPIRHRKPRTTPNNLNNLAVQSSALMIRDLSVLTTTTGATATTPTTTTITSQSPFNGLTITALGANANSGFITSSTSVQNTNNNFPTTYGQHHQFG